MIKSLLAGQQNKAVAGGAGMLLGAEFVEPTLRWLTSDLLSAKLAACCGLPLPDFVQNTIVWAGLLGIGYAVSFFTPKNRE